MGRIKRIYVRHYRDNRQTTAYVDWRDGTRTEATVRPVYLGSGRPMTWRA